MFSNVSDVNTRLLSLQVIRLVFLKFMCVTEARKERGKIGKIMQHLEKGTARNTERIST